LKIRSIGSNIATVLYRPSSALTPARLFTFEEPFAIESAEFEIACREAGFTPIMAVASGDWKPDADVLRQTSDVRRAVDAGATHFAIDPSEFAAPRAESFSLDELSDAQAALVEDGVFSDVRWVDAYLAEEFEISASLRLRFTPESLARCAIKYGWAVARVIELTTGLDRAIEVRFAESLRPATAHQHFFIARELQQRGVQIETVTLRLPGVFEPVADYEDNLAELESALADHVAVARATGSHRIGVRHAEWKFAALPVIGQRCGNLLNVETSSLGWIEALRTTVRTEPALFRKILVCAHERFAFDRNGWSISTNEEDVRFLPQVDDVELERTFIEDQRGRQLLFVTAGSILREGSLAGPLRATLSAHAGLHSELLCLNVRRHLESLTQG
jgi:hypothetical protein